MILLQGEISPILEVANDHSWGMARAKYDHGAKITPLKESITIEDVGAAAVWFVPNMTFKTIDEVLFIDSGYNISGLTLHEEFR
jgi:enoyl-[acyl-carrier-protein] reductase (NADH)